MFQIFDERSHLLERGDTGDYTSREYTLWQKEMRAINSLLGDTRALRRVLSDELRGSDAAAVSVLDVGAGSGELLIAAKSLIGKKHSLLVGAEINPDAARSISRRHVHFDLLAVQCNGLALPFADDSFDFTVSSLFLHHLDDEQAMTLIREMSRVAKKRFFIIDLHRHAVPYYVYNTLGRLFLQPFTLEDGSLSILKSFRPAELLQLAVRAGVSDAVVKRMAAFRLVLSGTKTISTE